MVPAWLLLHEQVMTPNSWGFLSLSIWVVASLPQIYLNHQTKQCGLQLSFLLLWMAGDAANVACSLFTRQKWIIVTLAVYCFLNDCVLYCQYLMYSKPRRSPRAVVFWALLPLCILIAVLNAGVAVIAPDDDFFGPCVCWLSTAFFTASRIPQIINGCRGKLDPLDVANVSKLFLFFLIAGNVTYIFSVLDEGQPAQWLGTLIAMLSDIVVTIQTYRLTSRSRSYKPPPATRPLSHSIHVGGLERLVDRGVDRSERTILNRPYA